MNLRFEKSQIRIRISQNEAQLLLGQETLSETFLFSDAASPLVVQIITHEQDFSFKSKESNLKIAVPIKKLNEFIQSPTKDAVCTLNTAIQKSAVEIIFEVDVFKKAKGLKI